MLYTAAFRQNCSSDSGELQFSCLLAWTASLMFTDAHWWQLHVPLQYNLHGGTLDLSKLCHYAAGNTCLWCLLSKACQQNGRGELFAGLPLAFGVLKFRTHPIPTQYLPSRLQHHGLHCTCRPMAYIVLILGEGHQPLKLYLGPHLGLWAELTLSEGIHSEWASMSWLTSGLEQLYLVQTILQSISPLQHPSALFFYEENTHRTEKKDHREFGHYLC